MCHNKIRDKLLYLSQCAFISAYVLAEPLIHEGRTRSEQEILQGSDKYKEEHGYVMVWSLWDRQVNAIIYVKLGVADEDSYNYEPMAVLLSPWEMIKKDKHGNQCHDQRKKNSSYFLSVDGMLGREDLAALLQLSRVMA